MSGPEIRRLYDGTRFTGLTVRPDPDWTQFDWPLWPPMWRIHYPDGTVSDMVNISRATDAALVWLRRNGTHHDTHSTFKWIPATSPQRVATADKTPPGQEDTHG